MSAKAWLLFITIASNDKHNKHCECVSVLLLNAQSSLHIIMLIVLLVTLRYTHIYIDRYVYGTPSTGPTHTVKGSKAPSSGPLASSRGVPSNLNVSPLHLILLHYSVFLGWKRRCKANYAL